MVDKAKDAYATFLDRRFVDNEVSLSLARIYFNEKDCRRVDNTLRGIDPLPEDALQMLNDCGITRRGIDQSQTMKGDKMSPLKLTLRLSTTVLFIGGIAGGYHFNNQVEKLGDDYHKAKGTKEADKLRDDVEKNEMLRNVFYAVGAASAAGLALTFFF